MNIKCFKLLSLCVPEGLMTVYRLLIACSDPADVSLLGDVGIAVEHEAGAVSVGSHIVPVEPVSDFQARDAGGLAVADLIKAVAGWAEDRCRELGLVVRHLFEDVGLRQRVVVEDVVERTVDTIVDVDCLAI